MSVIDNLYFETSEPMGLGRNKEHLAIALTEQSDRVDAFLGHLLLRPGTTVSEADQLSSLLREHAFALTF